MPLPPRVEVKGRKSSFCPPLHHPPTDGYRESSNQIKNNFSFNGKEPKFNLFRFVSWNQKGSLSLVKEETGCLSLVISYYDQHAGLGGDGWGREISGNYWIASFYGLLIDFLYWVASQEVGYCLIVTCNGGGGWDKTIGLCLSVLLADLLL